MIDHRHGSGRRVQFGNSDGYTVGVDELGADEKLTDAERRSDRLDFVHGHPNEPLPL